MKASRGIPAHPTPWLNTLLKAYYWCLEKHSPQNLGCYQDCSQGEFVCEANHTFNTVQRRESGSPLSSQKRRRKNRIPNCSLKFVEITHNSMCVTTWQMRDALCSNMSCSKGESARVSAHTGGAASRLCHRQSRLCT